MDDRGGSKTSENSGPPRKVRETEACRCSEVAGKPSRHRRWPDCRDQTLIVTARPIARVSSFVARERANLVGVRSNLRAAGSQRSFCGCYRRHTWAAFIAASGRRCSRRAIPSDPRNCRWRNAELRLARLLRAMTPSKVALRLILDDNGYVGRAFRRGDGRSVHAVRRTGIERGSIILPSNLPFGRNPWRTMFQRPHDDGRGDRTDMRGPQHHPAILQRCELSALSDRRRTSVFRILVQDSSTQTGLGSDPPTLRLRRSDLAEGNRRRTSLSDGKEQTPGTPLLHHLGGDHGWRGFAPGPRLRERTLKKDASPLF